MSSASHGDSSSSTTPTHAASTSLSTSTSSPGTDPPNHDHKEHSSSHSPPFHQSAASYFSYPVTHVVSGLYRRLTDPSANNNNGTMMSRLRRNNPDPSSSSSSISSQAQIFTPVRTVSPFQPPPLTPLTLLTNEEYTYQNTLHPQNQLLSRALAEEIRLLVPPRLQLVDTWRLAYSLDRDGASLSTLYENCRAISNRSPRAGYVLVIRDASPSASSVFGAYMTDPPHPNSHYFGTGECFLWRASVLPPPSTAFFSADGGIPDEEALEKAGLPPPPSADTTNVGRSTTLRGEKLQSKPIAPHTHVLAQTRSSNSGTSTPDRIRFKAFPYSGVNDYMMFCETGFLSLGGGDGRYGLWLDSSIEKGVSASCQTFGNEPLSDEGVKFDVIGVEVWYVGS